MYDNERSLMVDQSVSMMAKNIQVVSFDSDWREVYIGTVRRNMFIGVCAHEALKKPDIVLKCATKTENIEPLVISCFKWCPLESCTILALGSQFGVSFYDWDGKTLIYEYNFVENGIGCDAKTITGPQVKGIAAIGANLIAIGIHTGTILLFEISSDSSQLVCRIVDSQRRHVEAVSDVASTSMVLHYAEKSAQREILVSGDEVGLLNIWNLGSAGDGLTHRTTIDSDEKTGPVTAICLWNKVEQGVILSGFMDGSIKLFSITTGKILVDIAAHAAWITGLDLASQTGVFVSCAEDGFIRVWQLSTTGKIIEHRHSKPIQNLLMTGVKFIDPKGVSLAMTAYDSRKIRIFSSNKS